LGIGISSGANFLGALIIQNKLGDESAVVTVFPDDNKKYLSTDLMREQPIKDEQLAPDIKLLSVRALKHACHTCCDPQECLEAESTPAFGALPLPYCARRA